MGADLGIFFVGLLFGIMVGLVLGAYWFRNRDFESMISQLENLKSTNPRIDARIREIIHSTHEDKGGSK